MRVKKVIVEMLLMDEIISPDEAEIVEYGLENLGSSLLGMAITLMLGYCLDFFLGSFLLWLLIYPLRKNAGGFHAKTKGHCLLFSSLLLLLSILCFVKFPWTEAGYISVTAVAFVIIFFMAPVENHNKCLDLTEYRVYKKRTRLLLLLEGTLFVAAVFFRLRELITVITIDFFIVGISLVAGKFNLQMYKEYCFKERGL
ncbi:MAG: accessory gene regulator B family protein [Lachnoclostridium sp.]|nr:accessory gene regulator B family protein [Lachnospira sp.]MCM1248039.1 accessory gene regulator B family protein [Lachnoclostridium sp.]MCM1535856.1 accessory gene regulator B family protein [Clostridium sp.]